MKHRSGDKESPWNMPRLILIGLIITSIINIIIIIIIKVVDECVKYHNRIAELVANKNGESYSRAISWIRAKVSFAIVRSAILCLRGSRSRRRQLDFVDSTYRSIISFFKELGILGIQGFIIFNLFAF